MISINTVGSRYNDLRREMKYSSSYQEFVKSKIKKNQEFLLKCLILYKSGSLIYVFLFQLVNQKMIKDVFIF